MESNFKMIYNILQKHGNDVDKIQSEIMDLLKDNKMIFYNFFKMFNTTEMLVDGNMIITKDYKKIGKEQWIKDKIREIVVKY